MSERTVTRLAYRETAQLIDAGDVIGKVDGAMPYICDHVAREVVVRESDAERVLAALGDAGLLPSSVRSCEADELDAVIFEPAEDGPEHPEEPDGTYVAAWRTWV